MDCKNNSKQLFSAVNSISNKKLSNLHPGNKSDEEIANDFADFFIKKYKKIRDQFTNVGEFKSQINDIPQLKCFSPLTTEEVQEEIMSVKNKFFKLDIIPIELLKAMLLSCIETIAQIVNISLTKGLFATDWKTAIVCPLLKKPGINLMMMNYRPVSNLCFLSKHVKRCILRQLLSQCNTNNLIPNIQLAYRENYSMKTSLIIMCNDILWLMEKQQITMMVILNLQPHLTQ